MQREDVTEVYVCGVCTCPHQYTDGTNSVIDGICDCCKEEV
jgi:hypothetical protein